MTRPYVSEEHIRKLFHTPKHRRRFPTWQVVSASILIVLGIIGLINGPALYQQLTYWWESDIQESLKQSVSNYQHGPLAAPTPGLVTRLPISNPIPYPLTPTTFTDNTLSIPKINVKAPIIWDVTSGADLNTDLLSALRNGVVRYPETALPDQVGNVFLTGHSSNYWWDKGRYKTVFALLDKLVVGDTIYIKYNGVLYTYNVTGQKIVKPTETAVLRATPTPELSLMTCTPTGTTLFRRIVTASLISPTALTGRQLVQPNQSSLEGPR